MYIVQLIEVNLFVIILVRQVRPSNIIFLLNINFNITVTVYLEKELSLVMLMVLLSDTFLTTREQAYHR